VPEGPGLGVSLRPQALQREDLSRMMTDASVLADVGEDWYYLLGFGHVPPQDET